MIQEIFEKIVYGSRYMDNTFAEVEMEVSKCMEDLGEEVQDDFKEKIMAGFYAVAYAAEKSAFEDGFRYAMALQLSSLVCRDAKESE